MQIRLRFAPVVALAALFSACHDSTAPRKTVDVAVTLSSLQGPGISSDGQGNQIVTCQLSYTATATGEGTATWVDAQFRAFLGKSRTVPVDSSTISGSDIAEAFGGNSIAAGETKQSTWTVSAQIPFAGDLEFRYRTEAGDIKKSKSSFECAPPGATTGAAPSVTALSITPASGELEAGAPLNVSFTATVPAGLWQAVVKITGPCVVQSTIGGRFETAITQQVAIQLPNSCNLKVPIGVSVSVLDAALQVAEKFINSSLVIVDKTPPTLVALYFLPGGGSGQPTLSGDYFGGDSIGVYAGAADNHGVASVVWEVMPFGVRDSVVYPGYSSSVVWVHLKPEWSGPIGLKLWAHDGVGLTSDTVRTAGDAARVHPLIDRPTRATTVAGETRDIVIDSRRGVIYLRQGNDHRIAVLSMSSLQVTTTIALPDGPQDFDLSLSGDSLFVTLYGRPYLGVIDLRQQTLSMTTFPVTLGDAQGVAGVRVGANGKAYLALSSSTTAQPSMIELDMATHVQRSLPQAGLSGNSGAGLLSASADRSVIMLSAQDPRCIQRYDVRADAFSACLNPAVLTSWAPSVDGDGGRFAYGLDVYDAAFQLFPKNTAPIIVGAVPLTSISKDGEVLFVSLWTVGIVRVRASDGLILDRTPNPAKPAFMRVSPDGNTLVSVESNFGTTTKISLIDLR